MPSGVCDATSSLLNKKWKKRRFNEKRGPKKDWKSIKAHIKKERQRKDMDAEWHQSALLLVIMGGRGGYPGDRTLVWGVAIAFLSD